MIKRNYLVIVIRHPLSKLSACVDIPNPTPKNVALAKESHLNAKKKKKKTQEQKRETTKDTVEICFQEKQKWKKKANSCSETVVFHVLKLLKDVCLHLHELLDLLLEMCELLLHVLWWRWLCGKRVSK